MTKYKTKTYNTNGLNYDAYSNKGNFPAQKDSELERKLKQEDLRKLQEREDERRRRENEDANTAMWIAILAACM